MMCNKLRYEAIKLDHQQTIPPHSPSKIAHRFSSLAKDLADAFDRHLYKGTFRFHVIFVQKMIRGNRTLPVARFFWGVSGLDCPATPYTHPWPKHGSGRGGDPKLYRIMFAHKKRP